MVLSDFECCFYQFNHRHHRLILLPYNLKYKFDEKLDVYEGLAVILNLQMLIPILSLNFIDVQIELVGVLDEVICDVHELATCDHACLRCIR